MRTLRQRTGRRAALWLAIVLATIYSAFPFYWLFISSLTHPSRLFSGDLFPTKLSFGSYSELFSTMPVMTWLLNSLIVAFVVTLLTIGISVLAAYSLAFYRSRVTQTAGKLILFTYMFPGVVIIVPAFGMLSGLGLVNTLAGLVLVELVLTIPFCTWMLRSFFLDIPKEILEAGRVDGASTLRALWSLLLPVARPGVIAIAVFSFIFSWNEYLFPLVLINSDESKTLPLGVAGFMGNLTVQWGPLLASGVITVLPVLALFLVLQRYLVEGLTSGAVKG